MYFSLTITDPLDPKKNLTIEKGVTPDTIWINREDGEGGEFDLGRLYYLLDKFYDDNF